MRPAADSELDLTELDVGASSSADLNPGVPQLPVAAAAAAGTSGGRSDGGDPDHIRVTVRIRPLNADEQAMQYAEVVKQTGPKTIAVYTGDATPVGFEGMTVLGPDTDQERTFSESGVQEVRKMCRGKKGLGWRLGRRLGGRFGGLAKRRGHAFLPNLSVSRTATNHIISFNFWVV